MLATGSGLDGGAWRRGGSLRGAWSIAPSLFVLGGVRYEAAPRDDAGIAVQWGALDLGVSVYVDVLGGALRLELDAATVAALVRASASTATGSNAASRIAFGGRLTAGIAWNIAPSLAVVATSGAHLSSATAVQLRSVEVGRDAPLGYTLSAGARFVFR